MDEALGRKCPDEHTFRVTPEKLFPFDNAVPSGGSGLVVAWKGDTLSPSSAKNFLWGFHRDGVDSRPDWKESEKWEGEVSDMGTPARCPRDP